MLFTFPSRYWFAIGRRRVFSLGRWSSRIPTGFHVSRGTWETNGKPALFSPTGLLPCIAPLSRGLRLTDRFVTSWPLRGGAVLVPATPPEKRPRAITLQRFGLFPFRSPLLRESRLLSLPRGTEMVHFPPLASCPLWIQGRIPGHDSGLVAPFGDPRVDACLRLTGAYRSLPRPSSPSCAKASTVCP